MIKTKAHEMGLISFYKKSQSNLLSKNRKFGVWQKHQKKKRPDRYEKKLAIKGTFKDVFKVVKKNKEDKKKT